jgi:lysophospholipase L1-like esterase
MEGATVTNFTQATNVPRRSVVFICALGLALGLILHPGVRAQGGTEHWVGTWATAVVSSQQAFVLPASLRQQPPPTQNATPRPQAAPPIQSFSNQTIREIVHTTIGGSRARVVLTNAFGSVPLTIGAAHVAPRAEEASIVASSGRPLTFGGRASATIPAGAVVFSDPIDVTIAPFSDLAIDVFVPGDTGGKPLTIHSGALQTSYVSEPGNRAGRTTFPVARTTSSWYFVARVEVIAPASVGAVVTFGDSITDGTASTPNANRRWPDDLARRLASVPGSAMGVLNLGIGGNRLLSDGLGVSALARFDRDVAAQTGVTHVVVLEGINDIGFAGEDSAPAAADLIAAHQQLIARAHALGLAIYGATLTPFEGAAYATVVGEGKRQEVNKWIRTGGAYDGVIDFEAATRDPKQPTRALGAYDPGDHLHFTDAGYQTMADAVSLNFFRKPGKASRSR